MKQLTIRGLDNDLSQRLLHIADTEGISLSKAALRLLRKGAGLPTTVAPDKDAEQAKNGLERLAGSWSQEEAAEFDAFIEETFEVIDEEIWA